MPRKKLVIQYGPEKGAPTEEVSCRHSRTVARLKQLRQHYPQAFIQGLPAGTQGAATPVLRDPNQIVVLTAPAPVQWEDA